MDYRIKATIKDGDKQVTYVYTVYTDKPVFTSALYVEKEKKESLGLIERRLSVNNKYLRRIPIICYSPAVGGGFLLPTLPTT